MRLALAGILLGLAGFGLCASWAGPPVNQDKPAPAIDQPAPAIDQPAPAIDQPAPETVPAWMAEIVAIRRQLGMPPLLGAEGAHSVPGDAEFLQELQRLDQSSAPAASLKVEDAPPPVDPEFNTPRPASGDDAELTSALRHAARALDDRANRLEFDAAYEKADGYRKLAHRLRRTARDLLAASLAP